MPTNPSQPLVLVSKENLESYINYTNKENILTVTNSDEIYINDNDTLPESTNCFISKIQGQTRRYSENLIKFDNDDVDDNTNNYNIKVSKGVITINGSNSTTTIGYQFWIKVLPAGTYTFYKNSSGESLNCAVHLRYATNGSIIYDGSSFVLSEPTELYVNFYVTDVNNNSANNYILMPMLVKGTYTSETIPPFQLFNDNLVNSKANFLSTGKNLFNPTKTILYYITRTNDIFTMNNQTGVFSYIYLNKKFIFKAGKKYYIQKISDSSTSPYGRLYFKYPTTETLGENNYSVWFDGNTTSFTLDRDNEFDYFKFVGNQTEATNFNFKLQIFCNEYDEEYESNNFNTICFNQELGAYDYYDSLTNQIHRQTSKVCLLDGSSDEDWSYYSIITNGHPSFVLDLLSLFNDLYIPNQVIVNNYTNEAWTDKDGTFSQTMDTRIFFNDYRFNSLEEWKAHLQENPIQLVYKLKNETIENYNSTNIIPIYKNGMLQQEIEGNYLPYTLTQEYGLSLKSEVSNLNKNLSDTDYFNKILNKNENNFDYIDTISTERITTLSDIKSLPDNTSCIINKIQGHTTTKSKNLAHPADTNDKTVNGVTYNIKDGIIRINETPTATTFIAVANIPAGTYSFKSNYSGSITTVPDYSRLKIATGGVEKSNLPFTSDVVKVLTYDSDINVEILLQANDVFNDFYVRPMIVEGSYNDETMPSF